MAGKSVKERLAKSPINYFSDLFVIAMVVAWIATIVVMTAMAIYATVVFQDTSIWAYVEALVAIPLTAGGGIWMIKNSIQHTIAYNRGERAHMDFPAADAEGQDDGLEDPYEPKHAKEHE